MTALAKRRLMVLVVALLFLAFGLFAPYEQTITAQCLVEPTHLWSVRHFGSGMIAAEWDINMTGRDVESEYYQIDQPDISRIELQPSLSPGSVVKEDDPVATIQSVHGKNQLEVTEAALDRERERRELMVAGMRPEDIEIEKKRLRAVQVELQGFEREFERVQALLDSNLISPAEFEREEARLQELQAELAVAEARVRAAEVGVHPAELKMQDAEIRRLEAEMDGIQQSFGIGRVVHSPLDGIVSQKTDARTIVAVQGVDTLTIRVVFPEAFAGSLQKGMVVDALFPSLLGKHIQVRLDRFGFYGGDTTATYGIGLVSNEGQQLAAGMHGTAELPVGRMTLFQRLRNMIQTGS